MKGTQLLHGVLFVTMLLPAFVNNHFVFSAIALLSVFFGIRMFVQDKRQLKSAVYYTRRINSKWRLKDLFFLLVLIVFFIAFVIAMHWLEERYISGAANSGLRIYTAPIGFAYIFANYYQHFTNSIRSFENGLKLPGRSNPLIAWENIEKMTLHESEVTFEIAGIERQFKIDDRDREDANGMIRQWQENNDKTWDLDSI